MRQPSFIEGLACAARRADRLEAWRTGCAGRSSARTPPYLHAEVVEANFDFYGKTLTGTPELRARWKRGVSLVEGAHGRGRRPHLRRAALQPDAKTAMDVLVANLVEAYRAEHHDPRRGWPTRPASAPSTSSKVHAEDRLPGEVARLLARSRSCADDLLGNVRATNEFEFQRELGKIGKPLDRDEWFMTPQTINAYYNPGFNEIVFPAAILQFPFFDENRDAAANYGAIGAVIGHEIGHGFDDQGSKYDGDGRLTDWWTADDRAAFEARTASLIEQYDALEPAQVPDHHVNGALTIGENIGDLGGLGIAWKAYLISLGGERAARRSTG